MLHTQCSLCLLGLDIDTIFTKDRLTIEVCLVVKCVCVCWLKRELQVWGKWGVTHRGLRMNHRLHPISPVY